MPRSAASPCAWRALATSTVEQSMNSAPWFAAGSTPSYYKTCSPAGSMEMTTSALSTQLLALPTICTPSRAEVSREAGTTSKPSTRSPDLTRLAAMGPGVLVLVFDSPVDQLRALLFNGYLSGHLRLTDLAFFLFDGNLGV